MIIGTSFKLYLNRAETLAWVRAAADIATRHPAVAGGNVDLVIFPSMPVIEGGMAAGEGAPLAFGAQDLFYEDRGAFTGAVSGADLAELGLRYAEIGHAERRAVFGETDAVIARKVAAAARNGLTPWLCIGEPEAGDSDAAAAYCVAQLEACLAEVSTVTKLVVAYEPVWAIGQATSAGADHITAVTAALRRRLMSARQIADARIVYGGSAQPGTLTELGEAVDGLFLGRFAHDTQAFARIVDEAAALVAR